MVQKTASKPSETGRSWFGKKLNSDTFCNLLAFCITMVVFFVPFGALMYFNDWSQLGAYMALGIGSVTVFFVVQYAITRYADNRPWT